MTIAIPLRDRLVRHISQAETGCWLWLGSIDRCGYGKINAEVNGRRESLAHRASYFCFRGEDVPVGLEIDHICKTRSCINPEHLRAVTHADNVRASDRLTNHRNRRKDACLRGHPLDGENVRWQAHEDRPASRHCRACSKMHSLRRRAEKALLGIEIEEA